MQKPTKALVATHDDAVTIVVRAALEQLRFEILSAEDDAELLEKVRRAQPELLVLDSALPGMGAVALCRALREDPSTSSLPIVVITPEANVSDKVAVLETGADDCVGQPLHLDELMARIRAIRRRTAPASSGSLRAGDIEMDLERWTVTLAGKPVLLTKMEFRLLQALLEAKGRALTRDFLLEKTWSHGVIHGVDTRTVDVHIGRLRRKLGASGQSIITVRNVGFRFEILPEWISGHGGR